MLCIGALVVSYIGCDGHSRVDLSHWQNQTKIYWNDK